MTEAEDWKYRRADLMAHVKKAEDGWKASIGIIKPIGSFLPTKSINV